MEQSVSFILNILKMIITFILIFITPFILPLLLKVFLNWHWFENIEEFSNIIKIFYSAYPIVYSIITLLLLLWFFHKWEDIKEFLNNHDLSLGFKNGMISSKVKDEVLEESNSKKEFINEIKEKKQIYNESVKQEIKEQLGIITKNSKTNKCIECDKGELKNENIKLCHFAAYNIINVDTRSVLHIIYNEKYMETNKFKNRIIQGYKNRNRKNVKFTKKDLQRIANNKYETIFEGLKFLNIIEPSEDDKIIKLTKIGKEFVEKYIEKIEVV